MGAVRRVLAALIAVVALSAGALADPGIVAAGADVRMVDDDGQAAPGDCSAAATAHRTVRAAVRAASPRDRIRVCPGTYTETVVVAKDGLRITAATSVPPVLRAPREAPGAADVRVVDVLRLEGDGLTIRGIRFEPHGGSGRCDLADFISIQPGASGRIVDNRFVSVEPYGTSCGAYRTGVQLTARDRDSERIDFEIVRNVFRDFRYGVSDFDEPVRGHVVLDGNRFIVRHSVGRRTAPVAALIFHADTTVRDNVVYSREDLPSMTGFFLGRVRGAERNVVTHAHRGLSIGKALEALVADNLLLGDPSGVSAGLHIHSSRGSTTVRGNVVTGFGDMGFWVTGSGLVIRDNDFRGNGGTDCVDITRGSGTAGTANAWTNNLGFESDPAGLCRRS